MEGAILHLNIGIEPLKTRFKPLCVFVDTKPPPTRFVSPHSLFYRHAFRCASSSARFALPRALFGLRYATTTLFEPIPNGLDSNNDKGRIIRLATARRNNAKAASE